MLPNRGQRRIGVNSATTVAWCGLSSRSHQAYPLALSFGGDLTNCATSRLVRLLERLEHLVCAKPWGAACDGRRVRADVDVYASTLRLDLAIEAWHGSDASDHVQQRG